MPEANGLRLDDVIARRLRAYRRSGRRWAPEGEPGPAIYALDIPARTEALLPLTAFVVEAARRAGLPARETWLVEVALYEACLNVIEHAYRFDAAQRIHVDLVHEEERLTFRVIDTGRPLDRPIDPGPGDLDSAARRAGRGLGLRIIRRAMDGVGYETVEGENCLTLIKRVREAPARVPA